MQELRDKVGSRLLLVPSASVAVRDEQGRVLLARHSTGGTWSLPGGAVEPLETPADAAVREVWEEIGITVELTRIVGVYAGPDFVVRYENGDETAYLAIVFEARWTGGEARPDGVEVLELGYFGRNDVGRLDMPPWMPEMLADLFDGAPAGFRPPSWRPGPASRS
jgi:8-oxo-dGTP pyrophosphatase MutT (NUDIX family)